MDPSATSGAIMAGKNEFSVKDTHGLPFRPLAAWLPAPRRRPAGDLAGHRRPVVALVDTGVDAGHPWFAGGEDDPIVVDSAWAGGGSGGRRWHGTFVAGVIHQNGPDARILSVQLAQTSAGYVQDGQLTAALEWLSQYHAGGGEVDVVCIPVGFRPDAEVHDSSYIDGLAARIADLHSRGVVVFAAAGNQPVDAKAGTGLVYPAASAAAGGPLTAVGARALSGDHWLGGQVVIEGMVWYPGENVVSTAPEIDESALSAHDSAADLSADCGARWVGPHSMGARFGVGSGTSYAVGGYAGCVAQSMALGVPVASLLPAGPEPEEEQA